MGKIEEEVQNDVLLCCIFHLRKHPVGLNQIRDVYVN